NAAKFTAKERVVDFGSLKVKRCSDLLVEAGIEEPAVDTSVLVRVTRASGEQLYVHPGQTIRFDDWITETLKIAFVLKGSNIHSSVLYPLIHVIQGELLAKGDYVSRAMPAGDKVQAMITFDCFLPGDSGVKVEVGGEDAWLDAPLEDTTPLGDGKLERTYKIPKYVARDARVKLTLYGNPANRPLVSALRSNITDRPRNITE
ncbi:MAG: hypothetical protein L3J67_12990, partial [Hyphomicrobiaceae bacterium]|nr:hypothetical protein [Hyphomicrobiaceae bacterium]